MAGLEEILLLGGTRPICTTTWTTDWDLLTLQAIATVLRTPPQLVYCYVSAGTGQECVQLTKILGVKPGEVRENFNVRERKLLVQIMGRYRQ